MNKEQCVELLPAMQHFANGGNLWGVSKEGKWFKQSELITSNSYKIVNIIEDDHFKARKAFALGEEIEVQMPNNSWWIDDSPSWYSDAIYRPKPKEPVYEWQWYYRKTDGVFIFTKEHHVKWDTGWIKFEPSKRVRK